MANKQFSDQYKHPKWQKKRLEKIEQVMNHYEVESPICEWCHDTENQLHVHHIEYYNNHKIWEYENDELLLLCESCHKRAHKLNDELKTLVSWFKGNEDLFYLLIRTLSYLQILGINILNIPDILREIIKMNGHYTVIKNTDEWLKGL